MEKREGDEKIGQSVEAVYIHVNDLTMGSSEAAAQDQMTDWYTALGHLHPPSLADKSFRTAQIPWVGILQLQRSPQTVAGERVACEDDRARHRRE